MRFTAFHFLFSAIILQLPSTALATDSSPALAAGPVTTAKGDRAALADRIQSRGTGRVIIEVDAAAPNERDLLPAEAQRQAQALRGLQDSVLTDALGAMPDEGEVRRYTFIPFVAVTVTVDQLDRLFADPRVLHISEDAGNSPLLAESVPLVRAPSLWTGGTRGTNWTVAVIDTGIARRHPMLDAVPIVSEACFSSNLPRVKATNVCPGGQDSTAAGSAVNCPSTIPGCDHGTHVASIAAGRSVRVAGKTLSGVAPGAKLFPIQVFSRVNDATECGGAVPCIKAYDADILAALQRVYDAAGRLKIAAINLSLGGGQFLGPCDTAKKPFAAAFKRLRDVNIPVVVATGNDSVTESLASPACVSWAIRVSSSSKADRVSSFADYAANVTLTAPGGESGSVAAAIMAAIPTTGYAGKSGTSMAAPHVAGAIAMLRQAAEALPARPSAQVDDVIAALACSGPEVVREGIAKHRLDVPAAWAHLRKPPNSLNSFGFDSQAELARWKPWVGRWTRGSAGVYVGNVKSPENGAFTLTPDCQRGETITLRIRSLAPGSVYTSQMGILFRATPYRRSNGSVGVSGYYASISYPNATILRIDRSNWSTSSNAVTVCSADAASFDPRQMSTLRVDAIGPTIAFYINGKFACRGVDATFAAGAAGIGLTNGANADTVTADSFSIQGKPKPPLKAAAKVATN